MHLLHTRVAPISQKITKNEHGKKNLIKYSIKDSQDSFMIFGKSVEVMQTHILKLWGHDNPIQPFILGFV